MVNGTGSISITVFAPELAEALRQLAEAITGNPGFAPKAPTTETVPAEPAAPAKSPARVSDEPQTTFGDLHKALVELKQSKGSAQVREILATLDCKTVQDIPPEKFADVLRMAAEKMAA